MAVSLLAESYIWASIAIVLFLLRLIARSRHFGSFWRLKTEDAIMGVAFVFYICEIVFMNIVSQEQSNLLLPDYLKTHTLSPHEKAQRSYGSKITVVVEQCAICTIWLIKGCVLFMYFRLTQDAYPKHCLAVRILVFYVIFTWIVMEILYFAVWCRPFDQYWAVPTSNPKQCAAAWNHLITNAVFNLTSDLAMLTIALSMALKIQDRATRYGILLLTCLGLFIIACALANKGYSFTNPYGSDWTFWYVREVSTAVLIGNLPYVWTLLRGIYGKPNLYSASYRRSSARSDPTIKSKRSFFRGKVNEDSSDVVKLPERAYMSGDGRSRTDYNQARSNSFITGKADAEALEGMENYDMSEPHQSDPARSFPKPPLEHRSVMSSRQPGPPTTSPRSSALFPQARPLSSGHEQATSSSNQRSQARNDAHDGGPTADGASTPTGDHMAGRRSLDSENSWAKRMGRRPKSGHRWYD